MDECVLVADLQTGHPPMLHIRMIAVTHVNISPAAQPSFITMIEPLNAVQIMQIPHRRPVFSIDFERIQRLAGRARSG